MKDFTNWCLDKELANANEDGTIIWNMETKQENDPKVVWPYKVQPTEPTEPE